MPKASPSLATIDEIVTRLEKRLFGNGQPGVIQQLQEADTANREDVEAKHEANQAAISEFKASLNKYKWIGVGIILASGFISGSGRVSLETLLKFIGH